MKFKYLLFIGSLFLSLATISSALADGIFLSSDQLRLYSPEQKAIITWDGRVEQMVLASKVQSDKISNIVWLVPIQSIIDPEVQKSNASIFKDVISYFAEKEHGNQIPRHDQSFGKNVIAGVEVIENKKIDIYDVAILRATSTDDLLQWLMTNGYRVSDDARVIIEKYIQRPSMYFVANKINLKNKFLEDSLQAQNFYQTIKQRLKQKRQTNEKELNKLRDDQIAHCSSWQTNEEKVRREKEFSTCIMDQVEKYFLQMGKTVQIIAPDPHFLNTYILSIGGNWTVTFADFERLENLYFSIRYDNHMVLTDHFPHQQKRDISGTKYLSETIVQEAIAYADTVRTVLSDEIAFKKILDQQFNIVRQTIKDTDEILSAMSQWSENSFLCGFNSFQKNFQKRARHEIVTEVASGIVPEFVKEQADYCQTIDALQAGIATPLKISFQPDMPYYPLEISSLGEGSAMIDLYVIADRVIIEQNKIFQKEKSLALNKDLKERITKEFQSGPWSYVTRFTWQGELNDLEKDAEFKLR